MKRSTGRRAAVVARGFTLVEVVVALGVLSLVVLTLGATLRGMAGSAERIDHRMEAIDEMRVAADFLRDVLARAVVVQGPAPERRVLFEARPDAVAWIAIMPGRFGAAGRHAFRLALEPGQAPHADLVLRYAPWPDDATGFPDWTRAEHRVLARQVAALRLGYEGEGLAQDWPERWSRRERLPLRVRVDVAAASFPWPPLVLPVRVPSDAGFGGFVTGGGSR